MKRQQGNLMILAVVFLLLFSALIPLSLTLNVSNAQTGIHHLFSQQSFYLAETALQHGIYQFKIDSTYLGDGPFNFAGGTFTTQVSTTDNLGNPLPANQRRIFGSGTVSGNGINYNKSREAIVSLGGGFSDNFPDLSNWPANGPNGDSFQRGCKTPQSISNPATGGTVYVDLSSNAPGSLGGTVKMEVTAANSRLSGYIQHDLSALIPPNDTVTISFYYLKSKSKGNSKNALLSLEFVSTDNIVYRVWSDCKSNTNMLMVAPFNWTVPAGKIINRIRIGYDVESGNKTGTFTVGMDELSILTGSSFSVFW